MTLIRVPVPFMRAPSSGSYVILITSQRSHFLIPSHWDWGISTYEFGGDTDIQFITKTFNKLQI